MNVPVQSYIFEDSESLHQSDLHFLFLFIVVLNFFLIILWYKERNIKCYERLKARPQEYEVPKVKNRFNLSFFVSFRLTSYIFIPSCAIDPILTEFRGVKRYVNTWRCEKSNSLADALTWTSIWFISWVKHFYCPAINCDVLTCDCEYKKSHNCGDKVNMLFNEKILNVTS